MCHVKVKRDKTKNVYTECYTFSYVFSIPNMRL